MLFFCGPQSILLKIENRKKTTKQYNYKRRKHIYPRYFLSEAGFINTVQKNYLAFLPSSFFNFMEVGFDIIFKLEK